MKCCNRERTTNFCSVCGKKLYDEGTLAGLLKHCQFQATKIRADKRLIYKGRNVKPWKIWVTELEKIIK